MLLSCSPLLIIAGLPLMINGAVKTGDHVLIFALGATLVLAGLEIIVFSIEARR